MVWGATMQGIQVLNNLFLGADWKIRKNARLSHKSWDSWAIMLSQLWLHWGLARAQKKWHIFSSAFCSCTHIGVWSNFCAKTVGAVPILFFSKSKQTQNFFWLNAKGIFQVNILLEPVCCKKQQNKFLSSYWCAE